MHLKPIVMCNLTVTVVSSLPGQKEHLLGSWAVTESEGVKSPIKWASDDTKPSVLLLCTRALLTCITGGDWCQHAALEESALLPATLALVRSKSLYLRRWMVSMANGGRDGLCREPWVWPRESLPMEVAQEAILLCSCQNLMTQWRHVSRDSLYPLVWARDGGDLASHL